MSAAGAAYITDRALLENTVIPAGEDVARKAIGAANIAGVIAYIALKGGLENSSPAGITAFLGMGVLMIATGFQKSCNCTIMGGIRAHHAKVLSPVSKPATPAQKPLVKRKRNQFLTALVASAAAAAALTCGAYQAFTPGKLTKPIATQSIKGSALLVGGILLSAVVWPQRKK